MVCKTYSVAYLREIREYDVRYMYDIDMWYHYFFQLICDLIMVYFFHVYVNFWYIFINLITFELLFSHLTVCECFDGHISYCVCQYVMCLLEWWWGVWYINLKTIDMCFEFKCIPSILCCRTRYIRIIVHANN